jgi:predicted nucleic acid-binding protein
VQARRRVRIDDVQVEAILRSFEGLDIALRPVTWQQRLPFALRFERSAYDAAYLALAEAASQPLITGDARTVNAVCEHLDWVQWMRDDAPRCVTDHLPG